MKRIYKIALVLAGALAVLMCFPAPRHAFAEAVASAIGTSGSTSPQLTVQVGGSDGTNLRTLTVANDGRLRMAADQLPGVAAPSVGVQIGGTDGSLFRPLAMKTAALYTGLEQLAGVSDLGGVSRRSRSSPTRTRCACRAAGLCPP